ECDIQSRYQCAQRPFHIFALQLSHKQNFPVTAPNIFGERFCSIARCRLGQAEAARTFRRILARGAKSRSLLPGLQLWKLNPCGACLQQSIYLAWIKMRDANKDG